MFKAMWSTGTIKSKVILILVCILSVLCLFLVFKHQYKKIDDLEKQLFMSNYTHQLDKAIFDGEREKFIKTIEEQNKVIEDLQLDENNYKLALSEQEKQILVNKLGRQAEILKELEKDDSPENQLRLIQESMQRFSDGK